MDVVSLDETYDLMEQYAKRFKNFTSKLTSVQRDALLDYKQVGFIEMNRILNGQPFRINKKAITVFFNTQGFAKKKRDETIQRIRELDSIFASVPNVIKGNRPEYVYRGVDAEPTLEKGMTFTTKGFLSTSLFPRIASQFMGCEGCCIYKLILTKPIPYYYLQWKLDTSSESFHETEGEILLPRNLTFKVVDIRKVSLTKDHTHCKADEIKKSKTHKITVYVCELEEVGMDREIPDVQVKIV